MPPSAIPPLIARRTLLGFGASLLWLGATPADAEPARRPARAAQRPRDPARWW